MKEKIYAEIGANYRFFLGWRHAAFAGDLIVMYGVLSLVYSTYKDTPGLAWLVPALASPVGFLLWVIDVRTRELYHAAIRAGKDLEGQDGGFYTRLSEVILPPGVSPFKRRTQSAALDVLFIGSSIVMVVIAIALYVITH